MTYYYVVFDVWLERWVVTDERPAPWWPYHVSAATAQNCANRMNTNEGRVGAP